jgi:hypothetical protein
MPIDTKIGRSSEVLRKNGTLRSVLCEIAAALAIITLCNLPFWILSSQFFLARPILNADSALAGLLGTLFGPLVLIAGLLLTWALDATQAFSLAYHFHSAADFAVLAKYLQHLKLRELVSWQVLMVAALFALVAVSLLLILRRLRPKPVVLAAVIIAVTAVDVVNGSGIPSLIKSDRVQLNVNVQGSPLLNLVSAAVQRVQQAEAPLAVWPAGDTRMPDVLSWAQQNPDGAVLVVLIESWGLIIDPHLKSWMTRSLEEREIRDRFSVEVTTTPFRGSTTAGELRTLCNLMGHYSRLKTAEAAACLPNQLAKLGYENIGIHGFSSRMFERDQWWPTLGFQHNFFAEDLPPPIPRCGGVFLGICDEYLISFAEAQLRPRRMVYLLTLNTHLPLESITLPAELVDICLKRKVSNTVCQLTGQVKNIIDGLSTMVTRNSTRSIIIIAGDHSPPFLRDEDRRLYSQTTVPLVILTPR